MTIHGLMYSLGTHETRSPCGHGCRGFRDGPEPGVD